MRVKIYLLLSLIFIIIRIYPLLSNNFFFTADQGRDAVYVREILEHNRLFLLGPETTIRGLFTGPLWYYFVSIGYFFTAGHPAGGIIVLIVLNLIVALIVSIYFNQPILLFFLTFFWGYYQASRWSFNPFPLVPLSFLLILFSLKKPRLYLLPLLILVANTNLAGLLIFSIYFLLYRLTSPSFVLRSVLLTLITLVVLLFSPISRDWYYVFIPPLLLVSLLLLIFKLSDKLKYITLFTLYTIVFSSFVSQYIFYLRPSADRSVLKNQLAVIDYVYQQANNQGFKVFTYTDSYYDYTYQYLFWWYGLKKYGYLPFTYSNFPTAQKTYIPGYYSTPAKEARDTEFLIIDSPTNGNDNKNWIDSYRLITKLLTTNDIGQIRVEKRQLIPAYYEFNNINIIYRTYVDIGLTIRIPETWTSVKTANQMIFQNTDQSIIIIVSRLKKGCPSATKSGLINDFNLAINTTGIMSQSAIIPIITSSFAPVEDNQAQKSSYCP